MSTSACPTCGAKSYPTDRYCSKCGAQINPSPEPLGPTKHKTATMNSQKEMTNSERKKRGEICLAISAACIFIAVWSILISACGAGKTVTVDIPDDIKILLDSGTPKDTYTFYALADSQSLTWENIKEQGLWICGEYPPLIPEYIQSLLKSGGFLPGTGVRLQKSSSGMENLGMDVVVSVGVTLNGCTQGAIEIMKKSPGLILLVNRDADFEGKNDLTEVSFK